MEFAAKYMFTETMDISPEIAQRMIDSNTENNRNLKKGWVDALSGVMKRGAFKLSPQGIAFDKNGKLIDGQHRLFAVIKSGCTVPMRVTFGCDCDAFGSLDTGIKRTVSDIAAINNDEPWIKNKSVIGAFDHIIYRRNSRLNYSLSREELYNIVLNNSNIARVFYGCVVSRKASYFTRPMFGALLEAMICTGNPEALFDFRAVYENMLIPEPDTYSVGVVISLRNRLVASRLKHTEITKDVLYGLTQNTFYKFLKPFSDSKLAKKTTEDRYCIDLSKLFNGEYDAKFRNVFVTNEGIVRGGAYAEQNNQGKHLR